VNTPVPTMLPITRPVAEVSPKARDSSPSRDFSPSGDTGCPGGRTVACSAPERDIAPSYDSHGCSPRLAGRLAFAGGGRTMNFCVHHRGWESPLPPAIA
jgi:hypothetical protein